jgi:hypothetical protein
MEFGAQSICDVQVTEDEQFALIAFDSGQVNLNYIGDNSFTFVSTI